MLVVHIRTEHTIISGLTSDLKVFYSDFLQTLAFHTSILKMMAVGDAIHVSVTIQQ